LLRQGAAESQGRRIPARSAARRQIVEAAEIALRRLGHLCEQSWQPIAIEQWIGHAKQRNVTTRGRR
jgi:hypothetical protein